MFYKSIYFILVSSFITTAAFAQGYNCKVKSAINTNIFNIRNVNVSDLANSSRFIKIVLNFGSKPISYTADKDSIQSNPMGNTPNVLIFPDMEVHFRTNQDIGYSHQLLINTKNPEKSLLRLNREMLREDRDPSEDPRLGSFDTPMNCQSFR